MAKEDNLTRANTNTDLNEKLFGGAVVLELAQGNPNTPPQEADWVRFMAGTSKGMDLSPNSVTSDADDQGSFVETVVTSMDLANSFEGEVRKKDAENEFGFHKMFKFIVDKISAKQQPALWVRFNQGGSVLTAFMVVTAFSSNGGTNDLYTCSAEFKIACGKTVKVELVN